MNDEIENILFQTSFTHCEVIVNYETTLEVLRQYKAGNLKVGGIIKEVFNRDLHMSSFLNRNIKILQIQQKTKNTLKIIIDEDEEDDYLNYETDNEYESDEDDVI